MDNRPNVKNYEDRVYYGMRLKAPYRGMFSQVDEQMKALNRWVKDRSDFEIGPRFLRYHVIDMRGTMELEVGVFVANGNRSSELTNLNVLPRGRYATLTYRGLGLAANKALLRWIDEQGFRSDAVDEANGERFTARYEAYLTDPRVEPRKKRWEIELAIKLKD